MINYLSQIGLLLIVGASASAVEPVDFNRDIRPIFNDRCTSCHGGVKRKGGFSLLYRSETLRAAKSGEIPIVPGKLNDSAMHFRITTSDEDERMPPKGDRLSQEQVDTINRWISEGAPYADHWAYVKPEKQSVPKVKGRKWVRNHIDPFILQRLESEKLTPGAEASKQTLLRRLHLDLTGLPPMATDYDRFMGDRSKGAYEAEVNRLLASNRYGERWAGMWLDLARYADTQGYEKDNARSISPYRDWVIDAFNRDLGYDQFTIEQIAGDLLPQGTEAQLVATGFHRNTMNNTEGGTLDEEFRVAAVIDRVSTTWEVWMGTSFGCVQCHDHPYDPFLQKEYYQFMDFLNSTEDADKGNDAPFIDVQTTAMKQKTATLQLEIDALKKDLATADSALAVEQAAWEKQVHAKSIWVPVTPLRVTSAQKEVTLTIQSDGAIVVSGANPANDTYVVELATDLKSLAAIRIDTLPDKSFARGGSGRANDGNFVLSNFTTEIVPPAGKGERVKVSFEKAVADFAQKDYPVHFAIQGKDRKKHGWAQFPQQAKPHWAAFVAKTPVRIPAGSLIEVTLDHQFHQANYTLGKFRLSLTDDTQAVSAERLEPSLVAVIQKEVSERSGAEVKKLAEHYQKIAPSLVAIRKKIEAKEKAAKAEKGVKTLVMRELATPRATHIFNGGNWLSHGDEVTRATPGVMQPFSATAPSNRLGMAQWMVNRDNPLTGRVLVNRFWEQIFGNGIVGTVADFGTQGDTPTHPGLLDDLAVRFMDEQGWSMKALLKSFVMSATYRQSSHVTPALLELDPQNRLLARGPRYRLSAEQIRDQALAIGGLLSDKMFGLSVMPPQPEGVWSVVYNGGKWRTATGEDRHRRGLYTYWRRTSPYPSMESFDAPSREFCVTRRIRTNTPLQALVTLNDPAFIEAARAMGKRMINEGGKTVDSRLRYGFKLALSRLPTQPELRRMAVIYESEKEYYAGNKADAEALGQTKEGAEQAATWTAVANVFLNLDETLTRE